MSQPLAKDTAGSTLSKAIQELCESSRRSTRVIPGRKSWSPGSERSRLDFGLGHSGTQLSEAVVKTGPVAEITAEIALIRHLGERVCPKILGVWHGGYAMERLSPTTGDSRYLPLMVLDLLDSHVWPREGREQPRWVKDFEARFGFVPPGWVSERTCLIHGDPTLGNVAWQQLSYNEIDYRLLDPKPTGRGIPSHKSVDRGKVLQSLMGWEQARVLQSHEPQYVWPFAGLSEDELRRAIFWCGVHFMRIRQREGDTALGYWARDNAQLLGDLVGVKMSC